jgi:nucleoredoxin
MERYLGKKLINSKNEEISMEELLKTKVIALFFTASWCSPCLIFEKQLLEIYNDANMGDKVFEVIQISFDHTEGEFKKSLSDKPWVFFTYNDPKIKELSEQFNIESIPMFLVFNKNGKLLTDCGRKEINEEGSKIIDDWIAKSDLN